VEALIILIPTTIENK